MAQTCVIGVDLGGTNVRAGAFFEDGTAAGPDYSNPSRAQQGTPAIMEAMVRTIEQAIATASVAPQAIGIAIPGHVDDARGLIVWAPNFGEEVNGVFRNWLNVPVREPLQRHLSLPIHFGNDANLAALGEYKFGLGENRARCLAMLTLGTGIGGGVVLGPQSLMGSAQGPCVLIGGNGGGCELGHMVINHQGLDCNAGSYGALEAYCQRDSIVKRAQYKLLRGRKSVLHDLVDGDYAKIEPRLVSVGADQGDEVCLEIWREVGEFLGVGIGNLINVFAPDIFAIGGQIAKSGDHVLKHAVVSARNVAVPSLFADCRITLAQQIDDAGMLGGAALALEALKWRR